MPTLDFYYDIVCPYAYIASTQMAALEAAGVTVRWRPILLGGLLKTIGAPTVPMDHMPASKAALNWLDAHRQADRAGVTLNWPSAHPRRTIRAMRLLMACSAERVPALTADLYRAYWVDGLDVTDPEVLAPIAAAHGVDPSAPDDPAVKQALFDATAQAASAGAFGVPSMVLDGRLYWGADRLPLVRQALGLHDPVVPPMQTGGTVTVFHDFSSPYSYLGAARIQALADRNGATVEWVPMLLGAVFKTIGTPLVPIKAMTAPRQAYLARDLADWSEHFGIDFAWTPHFPLNTVAALRVAIQAPRTTDTLYRAVWVDGLDISQPDVLIGVLDAAGFAGRALVEGTADPAVKAQLRENTERAVATGVCGAPSVLVNGHLFWGQDRLPMVEAVLRGWSPPTPKA